jgi:hypothetical protein
MSSVRGACVWVASGASSPGATDVTDEVCSALLPGWKGSMGGLDAESKRRAKVLAAWRLLYYYGGCVVDGGALRRRPSGLFVIAGERGHVAGAPAEHAAVRSIMLELEKVMGERSWNPLAIAQRHVGEHGGYVATARFSSGVWRVC